MKTERTCNHHPRKICSGTLPSEVSKRARKHLEFPLAVTHQQLHR